MKSRNLKLVAVSSIVAVSAAAAAHTVFDAGASVAQGIPRVSQTTEGGMTRSSMSPATSLAQAVRSAEQRTGGRAAKVELERDDGVYVYEVKTISNEGPVEVVVNFTTGAVDRAESRGFLARIGDIFDSEDEREDEALLKALEESPVTLSRAIDAAVSNTGGRAIEARLRDRHGNVSFQVTLIVEGAKRRVEVDSATARIVAVKALKDSDDDDDDDDDD